MADQSTPSSSLSPLRMLIAVLAVGCLAGGVLIAAKSMQPEKIAASEVIRQLRTIALDGGTIGRWDVSAGAFDDQTNAFSDFTLLSGDLRLGATSARLSLDPTADTFTLTLHDVVYLTEPSRDAGEQPLRLGQQTSLVLGPVKYRGDIIAGR